MRTKRKKKVHIYGRDNRNAFSISSPAFQDQTLARSFLLKNIRRSAINLTQFRTNFVSTAHKFRLVGRECPKTVFGKKQHDTVNARPQPGPLFSRCRRRLSTFSVTGDALSRNHDHENKVSCIQSVLTACATCDFYSYRQKTPEQVFPDADETNPAEGFDSRHIGIHTVLTCHCPHAALSLASISYDCRPSISLVVHHEHSDRNINRMKVEKKNERGAVNFKLKRGAELSVDSDSEFMYDLSLRGWSLQKRRASSSEI